jgi:hypothetical protein
MSAGRQAQHVPLADVRALAPLARRTAIVRAVAAAALLSLAVAGVLLLRQPHVRETRFLPEGSNGIIVLDLSASISTETYSRIGATLTDLAQTRSRYGLVVFSDIAYEALPPETPGDALKPLIRFFTLPVQQRPGVAPTFPVNPWSQTFSGGTKISTGLELARSILIDEHATRPAVLLISDLDDDEADLVRVTSIVTEYQRERLPLHIVALNPDTRDEQYFRKFMTPGSFAKARLPGEQGRTPERETELPLWFAAVGLAVVLVLAGNELFGARLTWGAETTSEVHA